MANLFKSKTLLVAACVLVLAVVSARNDQKAFKELKDVVFGTTKNGELQGKDVSAMIHKMVALLRGGKIPQEAQGGITLNYLNYLIADCTTKAYCEIQDDFDRIAALKKRENGSPNFHTYLSTCTEYILKSCEHTVYDQAFDKLSLLSMDERFALEKLALKMESEGMAGKGPNSAGMDYHVVVLKALKDLDSESANKVSKAFFNGKKSLRTFMERIRKPCSTFLQNVNPAIEYYPPITSYARRSKEPIDLIGGLVLVKQSCESIIASWEDIVQKAENDYKVHLSK